MKYIKFIKITRSLYVKSYILSYKSIVMPFKIVNILIN